MSIALITIAFCMHLGVLISQAWGISNRIENLVKKIKNNETKPGEIRKCVFFIICSTTVYVCFVHFLCFQYHLYEVIVRAFLH